jgi:cell division protein FtsB
MRRKDVKQIANLKKWNEHQAADLARLRRQIEVLERGETDRENLSAMAAAIEDHRKQAEKYYAEFQRLKAENTRLRARLKEALTWR